MKSADERFEYLKLDMEPSSAIERPDRFGYLCPMGKGVCTGLLLVGADIGNGKSLQRRPDAPPMWNWDGNYDAPTLSPSIHCHAREGCGWHGFIERGVFLDVQRRPIKEKRWNERNQSAAND